MAACLAAGLSPLECHRRHVEAVDRRIAALRRRLSGRDRREFVALQERNREAKAERAARGKPNPEPAINVFGMQPLELLPEPRLTLMGTMWFVDEIRDNDTLVKKVDDHSLFLWFSRKVKGNELTGSLVRRVGGDVIPDVPYTITMNPDHNKPNLVTVKLGDREETWHWEISSDGNRLRLFNYSTLDGHLVELYCK